MNQQKYILSAILILVVGAVIYFGQKKLPHANDVVSIKDEKIMREDISGNVELKGRTLYYDKCINCHGGFWMKDGPWLSLAGVDSRWPDRKELIAYIRNPGQVIKTNTYARELKKTLGSLTKPSFPNLTDSEINSVIEYILWEKRRYSPELK